MLAVSQGGRTLVRSWAQLLGPELPFLGRFCVTPHPLEHLPETRFVAEWVKLPLMMLASLVRVMA